MKNKNIPQLRFPEFADCGEWEEKALGSLCSMQSGKFISASSISANETENSYPCYGGNGLRGYVKEYNHDGEFSLIGRQGALCGNITFASGKFYATEHALVATPCHDVDNNYLYYVLNLLNLNQYATGQAQPGLSVVNLEKVKSTVSSDINEQQKIADCLSSLDTLINAQSEKVDKLESHKKGLLQKLFPQEGQSLPKFRFPEFKNCEVWEEKTIGDIAKIGYGKDYKHLRKGEIPLLGSGGLMKYVNDYIYDGETVFIGRKGTIDNPFYYNGKFWNVDTLFYTHSFRCLPKFLYLLFLKIEWVKHSEASGMPSLSQNNIKKIKVKIPSQDEQQKIVECLFSLDNLIEQNNNKLNLLRNHKQGLISQLFPQ